MATLNTQEVLNNVNAAIAELKEKSYRKTYRIIDVCEELSIFDWWNENLSMTQLNQMRKFLETAIKMGFTGFACFKVGAKYCTHGMWAYTAESTDGYSPKEGKVLFHSFRSGDNYWDARNEDGKWLYEGTGRCEFTLKEVKEFFGK